MTDKEDRYKDTENKCKEFVLYFRELDSLGIPYGINDLRREAEKLGLPILSKEEINMRTDIDERTNNTVV